MILLSISSYFILYFIKYFNQIYPLFLTLSSVLHTLFALLNYDVLHQHNRITNSCYHRFPLHIFPLTFLPRFSSSCFSLYRLYFFFFSSKYLLFILNDYHCNSSYNPTQPHPIIYMLDPVHTYVYIYTMIAGPQWKETGLNGSLFKVKSATLIKTFNT